ncbi:ectoine dioxygenase-like [Oscarella lobularis]|uniref:ectoine dioxygenase-like n=1 Tax=Oscarella lobularis TaxID=121494 RepID=UPI00331444FD
MLPVARFCIRRTARSLSGLLHKRRHSFWIENRPVERWKENFARNGFLSVHNFLTSSEVSYYRNIYDQMLSGEIDARSHRHDLGSHVARRQKTEENVCQIMWPSMFLLELLQAPIHVRGSEIAKALLGDDVIHDFDMLISKAAYTDTPTPWHQDESYWPDMPDKRAVSCWVALDDATLDNGCMWFVPGSYVKSLREHRRGAEGAHILECDCSEEEGVAVPLPAGSCTFHHGRTLHYSRGNTTGHVRRAFIVNFRPESMVKWERTHDFDHGKSGIHIFD